MYMGEEKSDCKLLKIRVSVSWILLLTLILLFLSTTSHATEYKAVKAEDILKLIENDEDVNLTNCRIVGELDVSKIKLKTITTPYDFYKSFLDPNGYSENLNVIESNITFKNSIFEDGFNFSYVLLNSSADFNGSNFTNSADFS